MLDGKRHLLSAMWLPPDGALSEIAPTTEQIEALTTYHPGCSHYHPVYSHLRALFTLGWAVCEPDGRWRLTPMGIEERALLDRDHPMPPLGQRPAPGDVWVPERRFVYKGMSAAAHDFRTVLSLRPGGVDFLDGDHLEPRFAHWGGWEEWRSGKRAERVTKAQLDALRAEFGT